MTIRNEQAFVSHKGPGVILLLTVLLLFGRSSVAQQSAQAQGAHTLGPDEVAAWQQDLVALSHIVPAMHPAPFRSVAKDQFETAVRDLLNGIPGATRAEVVVGLASVVALLNDAHTSLQLQQPAVGFHQLPIAFHLFEDGLFVRAASDAYAEFVGARVVRVGDEPVYDAITAVGQAVSHENDFWVKQIAPLYMRMPEVLFAVGLSDRVDGAEFELEVNGMSKVVSIAAGARVSDLPHGEQSHGGVGSLVGDLDVDMFDPDKNKQPLWMRAPGNPYWFEYVPDVASRSMLYVAYRAVTNKPGGPSNRDFFEHVFAVADSLRPDLFVLDVRENGGGNGFYNRDLVRRVIQRPWLDDPERLFVVIGRGTFSAGIQLVNDLEYFTEATLVGEPTGNAPNQFGDANMFELPNSGIRVMVSSLWHQTRRPGVEAAFVAPEIYTPLTSRDYAAGRDPALLAITELKSTPTLRELVTEAALRGDSAEVRRRVDRYRLATFRKYTNTEAAINALGYSFLNGGQVDAAVLLFKVNAAAYPESVNTYDSLGEALEKAGRVEEAIAAFRHALALDPGYDSSRAALQRLTGEPVNPPGQRPANH